MSIVNSRSGGTIGHLAPLSYSGSLSLSSEDTSVPLQQLLLSSTKFKSVIEFGTDAGLPEIKCGQLLQSDLDGEEVVVKQMFRTDMTEAQKYRFKVEMSLHRAFMNQGLRVTPLKHVYVSTRVLAMIFQMMEGGNLSDWIRHQRKCDHYLNRQWVLHCIDQCYLTGWSLSEMHIKEWCHKNICMENLLIDDNDNFFIHDFGWCEDISNRNRTRKQILHTGIKSGVQSHNSCNHHNPNRDDMCSMTISETQSTRASTILYGPLPPPPPPPPAPPAPAAPPVSALPPLAPPLSSHATSQDVIIHHSDHPNCQQQPRESNAADQSKRSSIFNSSDSGGGILIHLCEQRTSSMINPDATTSSSLDPGKPDLRRSMSQGARLSLQGLNTTSSSTINKNTASLFPTFHKTASQDSNLEALHTSEVKVEQIKERSLSDSTEATTATLTSTATAPNLGEEFSQSKVHNNSCGISTSQNSQQRRKNSTGLSDVSFRSMSPERYQKAMGETDRFDPYKNDVWAFGTILLEVFSIQCPLWSRPSFTTLSEYQRIHQKIEKILTVQRRVISVNNHSKNQNRKTSGGGTSRLCPFNSQDEFVLLKMRQLSDLLSHIFMPEQLRWGMNTVIEHEFFNTQSPNWQVFQTRINRVINCVQQCHPCLLFCPNAENKRSEEENQRMRRLNSEKKY